MLEKFESIIIESVLIKLALYFQPPTTTKTSKSFYDFEFKKKDIVIFGKETAGLPKKIHDQINLQITIPMKKNTRSLNIATSVAIIATEISRQLI